MQRVLIFLFSFFSSLSLLGQETLPIYSDYLSDNVFLIHPSAAGIGNTGKIRLTGRKQWQGVDNAPELQTLSFHNRFGEKAALGFVVFNDKNGYHSQKGIQASYAYHLNIGNGSVFEQLSFGLSATAVQNQSDQRTFFGDRTVQQLIESTSYFNADFSVSYHKAGFSSYFTVKNLLLSAKNNLNNSLEPLDLRNYIFSAGYYFEYRDVVNLEPSFMLQLREGTGEAIADFNIKAYKNFNKAQLWAALSYRRSFDNGAIENLNYLSPIVGVNYNQMMISYTFTKQLGDIVFSDTGYHQITLGINVFQKRQRAAACPNINGSF
ncbi:PorP/SprF family type IX secretion system membrane protein [Polaribacter uvawellassae]|uniref:PorP/SprF family type IX secretion system membrane protein n=1 Tax=Polaribacter uvawellassae TaxID=3133495 RepID=UPI00321A458B